MSDVQIGDRVEYRKDRDFPYGNTTYNGQTGTVTQINPPRRGFAESASVDWDEGGIPITPYTANLVVLEAEVTPITTEYETDSHFIDLADKLHSDPVAHPSHYTQGLYEVWRVIRDWKLNFNRGSAVKYIARAGKKDDELQDLKKARQFLDFEIEALEAEAR